MLFRSEIAFFGTVDEFTAMGGKKHVIHIKTADGQKEYETGNITETLFTLLSEYKQKGISISEIQTNRISLEQNFINIVRGAE